MSPAKPVAPALARGSVPVAERPAPLGIDWGADDIVPVELAPGARAQGTYVLAKNGAGKSVLLEHLIVHDLEAGRGVLVLDPHEDLMRNALWRLPRKREGDVVILDPLDRAHAFGLNLYACANPEDPLAVVDTLENAMRVFKKLWGPHSGDPSWGPRLENLLRIASLTIIENGLTLLELPRLLTEADVRARLVSRVRNPEVRRFWEHHYPKDERRQQEYRDSVLNKVEPFVLHPMLRHVVGQRHSTVDLGQAMAQGKVIFVKLPARYEDLTTLLGTTLVSLLVTAAQSRQDRARPFCLYADEYQRFATPDFAVLLAEVRKYNIWVTLAHQFRGQFRPDDPNRGATLNMWNLIFGQLVPEDAAEVAAVFDSTPPAGEPEYTPLMLPLDEHRATRAKLPPTYLHAPEDCQHPIQGDTIYRQVEGLRRAYADVRDELANRLVNLPKYTFMGKLTVGRASHAYTFDSYPTPCASVAPAQLDVRMEHLADAACHTSWYVSRAAVEAELAARSDERDRSVEVQDNDDLMPQARAPLR